MTESGHGRTANSAGVPSATATSIDFLHGRDGIRGGKISCHFMLIPARLSRGPGRFVRMVDGGSHDRPEDIDRVRSWIDETDRIVVLTGAGISTDSGIPDFRGPNGVWTKNPSAEKAATLRHYLAESEMRRTAWRNRLENVDKVVEPNAGHRSLVDLERRGKLLALITQNVDGLHHAAGTDPARLIEVHGHTREVVCLSCGERAPMERALAR